MDEKNNMLSMNRIMVIAILIGAMLSYGHAYCIADICFFEDGQILKFGPAYTDPVNPEPPVATYTCTFEGNSAFRYGTDICISEDSTHICDLTTCTLGESATSRPSRSGCAMRYSRDDGPYCSGDCPLITYPDGSQFGRYCTSFQDEDDRRYCGCKRRVDRPTGGYFVIACGPSAICAYDEQTDSCSGADAETGYQCVRKMITDDGITKPGCIIPELIEDGDNVEEIDSS
jgi:hypothetical protein